MNTVDCMQGAGGSHPAISGKPVATTVLPDGIPAELKQYPQWVCWGHERDGQRWAKRPYSPRSAMPASVADPSTWGTFAEAVETRDPCGLDGIGFVLTRDDPYSIIDLDNKPEHPATPEQIARFQKIWDAFDSYTEFSPSGTGVHIVVKGTVPSGVRRDNVEVYSDARFMTFTGHRVPGRTEAITERQPWLDVLHAEMSPPPNPVTLHSPDLLPFYADEEAIKRAWFSANWEKLRHLWNGDWKSLGYPSQSEADAALMQILTCYSRNREQLIRLFRLSALGQREKAQRRDYMQRTVEHALSRCMSLTYTLGSGLL